MKLKNRKGFTLVELLIVITIIGLLAGGIALSIVKAQQRGRDAERVADINSVATALSAYYADNHGYPAELGTSFEDNYWYLNVLTTPVSYLVTLPTPVNTAYTYAYKSCTPVPPATFCPNYALGAHLETSAFASYPVTGNYQYTLQNGEKVNNDVHLISF